MKCPKCKKRFSLFSTILITIRPITSVKCVTCKTCYRRIIENQPTKISIIGAIGLAIFFFITQVIIELPIYAKIIFVILWGIFILFIEASAIKLVSIDDK